MKKKQKMNNEYKFSEEQIIEWSQRPSFKNLSEINKFCVGDLIRIDYREPYYFSLNYTLFGTVCRIYHTFLHHHKRIKIRFYDRFGNEFIRVYNENGERI